MSRFVPAGWAAEEVVRELIDPPSRAYLPFPELEIVDRPDFAQLSCVLFPRGGFNGVSRAKLSADDADQIIDRTIAGYETRGLAYRWSVMPGSTPEDLAQRLEQRGLVSTDVVAMARSTAAHFTPSPGVEVEQVTDADEYSRVMSAGWGAPIGALLDYHRHALADPQRRQRLFLARVDGEAAGVAAAMLFPRSVFLLGGVVLERFRRRGAHAALTAARLSVAAALGVPLATTHAIASTSAPLLARQGWDEWFRFPSLSPRS